MTTLRVLIAGAGEIGRRHLAAVEAVGDRVVAIVDPASERARAMAGTGGASAYDTIDAALEATDVDAVVIATPSALHLRQAVTALRAGVDVLVEKPHRVPGEDPAALRDVLPGRRYAIGMTTRHWPGMAAIAGAVRAGTLGEVLSYTDRLHFRLRDGDLPPWYFDAAVSGGGVLATNGVHALDRARAVLGDLELDGARLARVFDDHPTEDSVHLRLRTADGVPVEVSLLWAPYEPLDTGIVLTGTAGVAAVRMDGSWQVVTAHGRSEGPPLGADDPFERQWRAFRDGTPGFGLDDLEPTLRLVERIYREDAA